MLNKVIRSTIIVTIQFIVPAVLIFILAPQLLNHTHQLSSIRDFFNQHQLEFVLLHCGFYLGLFWIWPRLIRMIATSQSTNPDVTQIKSAISARWYLITIMVFFELLSWWK